MTTGAERFRHYLKTIRDFGVQEHDGAIWHVVVPVPPRHPRADFTVIARCGHEHVWSIWTTVFILPENDSVETCHVLRAVLQERAAWLRRAAILLEDGRLVVSADDTMQEPEDVVLCIRDVAELALAVLDVGVRAADRTGLKLQR